MPAASVAPVPDLQLPSLTLDLLVAPGDLAVGESATFAVTVRNQAPDPAHDQVVTLPAPASVDPLPGPGLITSTADWR